MIKITTVDATRSLGNKPIKTANANVYIFKHLTINNTHCNSTVNNFFNFDSMNQI